MREHLDKIRAPEQGVKAAAQAAGMAAVLLLGAALGAFAKWLDNLPLTDEIGWHRLLDALDLRNVFSLFPVWLTAALAVAVFSKGPLRAAARVFCFFVGVCVSYHAYTVVFCGFNPARYMLIWYGFTAVSPLFAAVCWYGKGKTAPSVIIDILILAVMLSACFSFGFWYFDCRSVINVLLFSASVAILYASPKQTIICTVGAAAAAVIGKLLFGVIF